MIPAPGKIFLLFPGLPAFSSGLESLLYQTFLASYFLEIILKGNPGANHFRGLRCINRQSLFHIVCPVIASQIRVGICRNRKFFPVKLHKLRIFKYRLRKIYGLSLQAHYIFRWIFHICPAYKHFIKSFCQSASAC